MRDSLNARQQFSIFNLQLPRLLLFLTIGAVVRSPAAQFYTPDLAAASIAPFARTSKHLEFVLVAAGAAGGIDILAKRCAAVDDRLFQYPIHLFE